MAIITLQEVKDFGGITGYRDEIDNRLTALITGISAAVSTYCDREFESSEYTEYHDGHGTDTLYVYQYPITSVSGIWQDGSRQWTTTTEIDSDYYFFNDQAVILKDTVFYTGPRIIKIIYTAGYTSSTMPEDLKGVVKTEVYRAYKNLNNTGISTQTVNETTTTYITNDFLPQSITILDKYKKYMVF